MSVPKNRINRRDKELFIGCLCERVDPTIYTKSEKSFQEQGRVQEVVLHEAMGRADGSGLIDGTECGYGSALIVLGV